MAENELKTPWSSDPMTDWIYGNDEEPLLSIQFEDEEISPESAIRISDFVVEAVNEKSGRLAEPDGDEVVISKQSLKDLLFLAKDYETRGHYSQAAYDKFAAAVAEGKEKLGEK